MWFFTGPKSSIRQEPSVNTFHCGLYCRAVSITDNLCNKQWNSLIFGPKICGLWSRAGYNGARTVIEVCMIGC